MSFSGYDYIPLLGVRPAEMKALEETAGATKDRLLPLIVLQPWVGSKHFLRTTARVEASFGNRPVIADLTDEIYTGSARRPVHDALDELRDPANGYANWYAFLDTSPNYIPTLQVRRPAQIAPQIPRIVSLGRGVAVRLTETMLTAAGGIASIFRGQISDKDIIFIIDLERQTRDILSKAVSIMPAITAIRGHLPGCMISVSASTFPESFVGLTSQNIFERQFFDLMKPHLGEDQTIYCDRASVRAERQSGGGGSPAPRIDNALARHWRFYREPNEPDRDAAYQLAASAAKTCSDWTDLGIWGTERIKITAAGGAGSIGSAVASTAARINIHLHVQASGSAPASVEEDWSD